MKDNKTRKLLELIKSDKIEPTGRQSCCNRGPLKGVLQIRIRMNSSNDILSLSEASFIPLAFIDKQPIYCAASRRQCDQICQKYHFGKKNIVFGNFFTCIFSEKYYWTYFGKFLCYWTNFHSYMAKYWKNNLAIWSHWPSISLQYIYINHCKVKKTWPSR